MFCGLGDILLGGENITNRINRVMIVDTLGETTTAQLFLKVGEKLNIGAFQTVSIEDADGSLLFGGRVEGYPDSTETKAGSIQKIICRDWSVECGYRQVIEHFSDWAISDIYRSLIQKYLPGHTTDNVCETTETATLRFNGISVNQCLNILADLTGWTWKVSADRDHYFGETFLEHVTEDITDEVVDTAKGRTTNFEKDYTTLANRVWVEGGEGLAKNFSEQYVKLENLEKTAEPLLRENYTYQIPVWYRSDGVKVFAIYDKGDGEIENGKLVQLDCGANADIAGQNVYMPTAENFAGSSHQFAPTGSTTVTSSAPLVKLSTARNVVTDYDAIFVSDPTEKSAGGYVYIGDLERNKVDLTKGPWRYGFIGDRLKQNIDPDGTPKVKDTLLGYMIRYRRRIQISIVTDVDEESVSEYGVQIDLPKVCRPAIKDWSILYKYADYLLAKHKDPPRKGRVTVYRFKNGEEVYNHNLKAGQLVDINLSRFGTHNSVKLTKITHEITPETWRILADSTLDPQLYSTMLADVMRRIHQLEQEDSSGEVINSVTTITSYFETVNTEPEVTTLNPEEDYGFGLSGWGSSEWEG